VDILFFVSGALIASVAGFIFAGALAIRLELKGIEQFDTYLFGTLLCSAEGGFLALLVSAKFGFAAGVIALFCIAPAVILTWTAVCYLSAFAMKVLVNTLRRLIATLTFVGSIVSFLADRCAECVRSMLPPKASDKRDSQKPE
jgi:hypothetical protein